MPYWNIWRCHWPLCLQSVHPLRGQHGLPGIISRLLRGQLLRPRRRDGVHGMHCRHILRRWRCLLHPLRCWIVLCSCSELLRPLRGQLLRPSWSHSVHGVSGEFVECGGGEEVYGECGVLSVR